MEGQGYQLENAEGTFELLIRRGQSGYQAPFELLGMKVLAEKRGGEGLSAEATVKVRVGQEVMHIAEEGDGPVRALDGALRKALMPHYPRLSTVSLVDYKVRILDPESATDATTRVFVEASAGTSTWCTVGCSKNIIDSSFQALADSYELFLVRTYNDQSAKA